MEKLVLISGLSEKAISELEKFVEKYFCTSHLEAIWKDPKQKARAVVMFQEAVDLKNILKNHYEILQKQSLVIRPEKPTKSIFVKTYNVKSFGLIDKLGYLFAKSSHCTISDKTKLEDGSFELILEEEFDEVLKVCEKTWTICSTKLTVCPYFDGFKECYEDQHKHILKQNKLEMKHISPNRAKHVDLLHDVHISSDANNTENICSLQMKANKKPDFDDNCTTSFYNFTNKLMPKILTLLNVMDAVQCHNCEISIDDKEAEIYGPKSTVKKILQCITKEDEKECCLTDSMFTMISLKYNKNEVVLSNKDSEFRLDVVVENSTKMPFREFVSSIVQKPVPEIGKIQLPSSDLQLFVKDDVGVNSSSSLSYDFQHNFCLGILEVLNLQDALKDKDIGITIKYEKSKAVLNINGPSSEIKLIISTIEKEEKKITLKNEEKLFLEETRILNEMKKMCHRIDFSDSSKMLVKVDSLAQAFSDYVNALVITEIFPFENSEIAHWKIFVDSFNEKNIQCHLSIKKNTVIFICLNHKSVARDILIQLIKENLKVDDVNTNFLIHTFASQDRSAGLALTSIYKIDVHIKPIFLWLLNHLHIKKALQVSFPGIGVEVNLEKYMIIIESSHHYPHICSEMEKICNDAEDTFSNAEYQFLKEESVQNIINQRIKNNGWHFVVDRNDTTFFKIQNSQKETINFSKFLSELTCRTNIISLKDQNSRFSQHLVQFVTEFKGNISPVHIIIEGANIALLTVLEYNVNVVNQVIEGFILNLPVDCHGYISRCCNISRLEEIIKKMEYPLSEYQYEYCKNFLQNLHIEGLVEHEVNHNKLYITYKVWYSYCIVPYFKNLITNLQPVMELYDFCGLAEFALLEDGQKIISKISQSTQCYITFTTEKIEPFEDFEEIEAESKDYKVILLHSAHCEGFHIHLVQGKIDDMEIEMSIRFLPTKNPLCSFQRVKPQSKDFNLFIPSWSADGQDFQTLINLRESFKIWINAVIEQAKHDQIFKIAFSFEKILEAEYPFPLDVLAKTILGSLSYLNADIGATSVIQEYDIYICEPDHESVFQAFRYFTNILYSTTFTTPDQEKWDKISPPWNAKFSGDFYKKVIVQASNRAGVSENELFCYPISPNLNASTCPVVKEKDFSSRMLEDSIQYYEDSCPEGVPVNGYFSARCFPYANKDVLLYCCPEWGLNASEVIYDSLKLCLLHATNKKAVHIVPPGTYLSRYPAKYLAQTVFKALDTFLYEGICPNYLNIVFIINDFKCKKVFDKELAKRQITKHKQSLLGQLFSFWWSSENDNKEELSFVKSKVEKTPVIFVAEKVECIFKAKSQLHSELTKLMSANEQVLDISEEELKILKDFISKKHGYPIVLDFIESDQTKHQKFKKKSFKKKMTIQGLNKRWVTDFINEILKPNRHQKQQSNSTAILNNKVARANCNSSPVDKRNQEVKLRNKEQESLTTDNKGKTKVKKSLNSQGDQNKSQKQSVPESKVENSEFTWKFENPDSFDDVEFNKIRQLEKFYLEDTAGSKNLARINSDIFKGYVFINFVDMTITSKGKEYIKMIRSEKIKEDDDITFPNHWEKFEEETFLIIEINNDYLDENGYITELKKNFEIIKIEQVQNKHLFSRFQSKCNLIQNPKQEMLLHRVSENNVKKVCKYGFHRIFSAIPKGSELGEGVAFTSRVDNCFLPFDTEDIYLFIAAVLTGKSGPSKKKQHVRSPPVKCHSIKEDENFMIFSDAQAYPHYLIKLRGKKAN